MRHRFYSLILCFQRLFHSYKIRLPRVGSLRRAWNQLRKNNPKELNEQSIKHDYNEVYNNVKISMRYCF